MTSPGRALSGCLCLTALTIGAGCVGSPPADASQWSTTDSAGVEIVTSHISPTLPQWRVSEDPVFRIGSQQSEAGNDLYQVMGALRLRDGRVVIANEGSLSLRFYTSEGRFESETGRRGRGPGEYMSLRGLAPYRQDSLIVYDFRAWQYSVLDQRGAHARSFSTVQPDDKARYVSLQGTTFDGGLLMLTSTPIVPSTVATIARPIERLFVYTPTGRPVHQIGSFPGRESYTGPGGAAGLRRFGRRTLVRVSGSTLFVGTGDSYEVGVYGIDGHLQRLVRKDQANAPVEPRDIELDRDRHRREIEARFAGWSGGLRKEFEALIGDMPYPETLPAYAELRVDDDGSLWAREYLPIDEGDAVWSVFDPRGRLTRLVHIPAGLTVYDVDPRHVLVGLKDELDVEYVELRAVLPVERQ